LIRAVHRHAAEIALAVYAGFVAYVSFVPFDLTTSPPDRSGPGDVFGLGMTGISVADIFANLAFYVPLGALGFIALRRSRLGAVLSACVAVALAAMFSFGIEYGQHWLVSRVASWVDVITNVLGAGVGVIIVGAGYGECRRLLAGSRASARRNWWLAVSKVAVCGVLLVHLRPFDVAVDLFHTAAAVRYADVSPLAAWHGLEDKFEWDMRAGRRASQSELARMRWDYALDRTTDVAGYAGLTVLLAFGVAPQFLRRRGMMFAWIGFIIVSLATMITVIRIFLISHGLDTAHVFCGVAGWLLGCALPWSKIAGQTTGFPGRGEQTVYDDKARAAMASPVPSGERHPRSIPSPTPGGDGAPAPSGERQLPRSLQNTAMILALILCAVYELVPFDFVPGASRHVGLVDLFRRVPFAMQLAGRPNDAFYAMSGELLRYGAIGACLAVMMLRSKRWPWRGQLIGTILATGAVCLAFQLAHLNMASRHADVTALLLALAGAFAGGVAVRWARDYRAAINVIIHDDLLTGQLIEGETYDRIALSRPETPRSDASQTDQALSGRRE
jgi:glycopeptide antibiotics resistance protein